MTRLTVCRHMIDARLSDILSGSAIVGVYLLCD